jgi:putative MATE family efflux protein
VSRGGPITGSFSEAFRLSWPITLSLLLNAGYRVNDQYWIRDLGPDAQAAMGITSFMLIFNFAFVSLISTGVLARVARHTGAGDLGARKQVVGTGLRAALVWYVVLGIVGRITTPFWIELSGGSGASGRLAIEYLGTIYLVLPLVGFKPLVDSIFLGIGNTVVPMVLGAGAVILNAVLNPALIYGWWGFPPLGLEGAAWATGISRLLAALAGMAVLRGAYGLKGGLRTPFAWGELRRVLRIGAPVAFSTGAYALCFIGVLKTSIAPLGSDVQAGLGVAFNGIESLSYCGLMGPAMAAASLVGRGLGAGNPEAARAGGLACLTMSVGFAALTSLTFLLAGDGLAGFYADDPDVRREAALYLAVMAWSQMVTATDSTLQQMMAGAGRTIAMSLWNTGGYLSRIPLAWFLSSALGHGAAGVWWALNLSNFIKLGGIFLLFRRLDLFAPAPQVPATPPASP